MKIERTSAWRSVSIVVMSFQFRVSSKCTSGETTLRPRESKGENCTIRTGRPFSSAA
jgi:hypothetical protein